MESNDLILGRIPSAGGGIRKTYPESIIRLFAGYDKDLIQKALSNDFTFREKLYVQKSTNDIITESEMKRYKAENEQNSKEIFKEVEILCVVPFGGASQHGGLYHNYFIEVIEKDILYRHLRDERYIIERELEKGSTLTLN